MKAAPQVIWRYGTGEAAPEALVRSALDAFLKKELENALAERAGAGEEAHGDLDS